MRRPAFAARRRRSAWTALTATVAALLAASCATPAPPEPAVITDKGTPYGDLLVPKLEASGRTASVSRRVMKSVEPMSH